MNAKNIFGAVMVAIALFFVWPGIFNSWAEMRSLKAAVAERKILVAEREAILKNAADEYKNYQTVVKGDAGTTFKSLVPTKKDSAELVSATQAIATTSGLQLEKISISEDRAVKDAQYATIKLKLEMSGPYSGLRAFLSDLESYVRILNVKNLAISTDVQTGTMKFTVEAETYFIK
jgi:Tfp pilus assembly protein PilO